MNLRKYIFVVSLLLAAWITPLLGQEYLEVVCAGDTGMAYNVKGFESSTFNWSLEGGGTISRKYGDSIIVDWGLIPGAYTLSVQEVTIHGCVGDRKTAKILVSAPSLELGADAYVCEGDFYTITIDEGYESIEWNNESSVRTFTTSEQGMITCKVTDQYGCSTQDELYLEIKPLPYVYLGKDTALCGDQSLYLNGGDDANKYNWSTGESSQEIHVYQGYKEISVQVEDEYECKNSDAIIINDCDPSIFFKDIVNAITPSNQDGINDVWDIKELRSYPDAVVDIYDRWGRLIWRSEAGYPTPWDGRNMNGNDVPMDSYHYVIRLYLGEDGRVIGSVTVIR